MGPSLLSLVAVVSLVQAPEASVAGVIREAESGRPLAGALVQLGDVGRGTLSGPDGTYRLANVGPGPKHLTVSSLGHATRTLHALVPVSGVLELDVALVASPIRLEGLTVEPRRASVARPAELDAPHADRTVSIAAVRSHPLLGEPDVLGALAGGMVALDPEAADGVSVRGGAADHTAYELDGVPIFDAVHAAGMLSTWNPDALAEVALTGAAPAPSLRPALAGVVSGFVRAPGARFGAEGHLSTTHGGLSVHGPLGGRGAGYVLSMRSGYPGAFVPHDEPSYLRGETGDGLLKVRAPFLGGELGFLGYSADNELLGGVPSEGSEPSGAGSVFEWGSSSVGMTWSGGTGPLALEMKSWRAESRAGSSSSGTGVVPDLSARREELGAQVLFRSAGAWAASELGVRLDRTRTAYDVAGVIRGDQPTASLFGELSSGLGSEVRARIGASFTSDMHRWYVSPRVQAVWAPTAAWALALSASRMHQFTQSLRNSESVVGHVFPADLMVSTGTPGIPVPVSDQVVLSWNWSLLPSVRAAVQGFARATRSVVLVASGEVGPYAVGPFDVGSSSARGASVEVSGTGARYSWLLSYGLQRVEASASGVSYAPRHGPLHTFDAGVVTFPSTTLSIRAGLIGIWRRRSTDVGGAFEWEACNLVDLGCEFAGSPVLAGPLGGTSLPPYLRLDLGVRKHWHLRTAGKDTTLGLFATVTNVLGRTNALVMSRSADGSRQLITMRPRAPLVVGLDWEF